MWDRHRTTCSLVCDYCGKKESIPHPAPLTDDLLMEKIRERHWRTVGRKVFCHECVTEVHG